MRKKKLNASNHIQQSQQDNKILYKITTNKLFNILKSRHKCYPSPLRRLLSKTC